jgi:hypothetical protein
MTRSTGQRGLALFGTLRLGNTWQANDCDTKQNDEFPPLHAIRDD